MLLTLRTTAVPIPNLIGACKMKIITVWDIQVWDGGDRHQHKYYVASKEAADEWMKENKFDFVTTKDLVVFDDLEDIKSFETGEVRRRALEKLTDAEKIALGVK